MLDDSRTSEISNRIPEGQEGEGNGLTDAIYSQPEYPQWGDTNLGQTGTFYLSGPKLLYVLVNEK